MCKQFANKLHFIASVFGAFHSSCRFLSGYSVTSLTTGPEQCLLCEWKLLRPPCFVSWWGEGGPCYRTSLCSVESNRYFFNFLMVDREGDNLNPGKTVMPNGDNISKSEPQIIFSDSACILFSSI